MRFKEAPSESFTRTDAHLISLSDGVADLGGNDVGLLILMFSHHENTSAAVRMQTKKTVPQQRSNRMEKVGQSTQW